MKGMRDKDELHAEFAADGAIHVENHFVGRLKGFRFQLDPGAEGIHGKATRNAAAQVLARELAMRARRVAAAQPDALSLNRRGRILWRDEEIAPDRGHRRSAEADGVAARRRAPVRPRPREGAGAARSVADADHRRQAEAAGRDRQGRGHRRTCARHRLRLRESLGVLRRETVAEEIKSLDQNARAQLRKYGVRFGAFNIYFPILLKPAAAELILTLWSLKNAGANGLSVDALPDPPRAGLTSFTPDPACPEAFYRAYGYHVCGPRAVRLDMLERLADLIRPLLGWRGNNGATPPKGATGDGGFTVDPRDDVAARLLAGRAGRRAQGAGLPSRSPADQVRSGGARASRAPAPWPASCEAPAAEAAPAPRRRLPLR